MERGSSAHQHSPDDEAIMRANAIADFVDAKKPGAAIADFMPKPIEDAAPTTTDEQAAESLRRLAAAEEAHHAGKDVDDRLARLKPGSNDRAAA